MKLVSDIPAGYTEVKTVLLVYPGQGREDGDGLLVSTLYQNDGETATYQGQLDLPDKNRLETDIATATLTNKMTDEDLSDGIINLAEIDASSIGMVATFMPYKGIKACAPATAKIGVVAKNAAGEYVGTDEAEEFKIEFDGGVAALASATASLAVAAIVALF